MCDTFPPLLIFCSMSIFVYLLSYIIHYLLVRVNLYNILSLWRYGCRHRFVIRGDERIHTNSRNKRT